MLKRVWCGLVAAAVVTAVMPAEAKTVRIASHVSETSPLYDTAQMFAERSSEQLPDEFEFRFFPNGQLGKEKALIDSVRLGSLEMAMVASGIPALDNKLGIFDLPWLFTDRAHVQRALGGAFGAAVIEHLEANQNFVVLGIYENGFRHVVNNKRVIETPADMDGLKIRVTGSTYKRDGFTAMGADPVPIAWQETFTAIQQGVVDGAEAALYGFYGAKLYEITDYLSLTNHTYSPSFLIASKTFWGSLTDEQQQAFRTVAQAMSDDAFQAAADAEDGYLEKMKGSLSVNDVEVAPFQEKAVSVYDSYIAEYGEDWLKMVRSAAEGS